MAYSATNWRDRIAYYSGSTGGRAWSQLGAGQFQGKYVWEMQIFGSSTRYIVDNYRPCTTGTPRNAGAAYIVHGMFSTYLQTCFGNVYASNTTYYYAANYVGAGNTTDALGTYYNSTSCGGACCTSQGNFSNFLVSVSPSAYYSYTPWGGPPYFAGSNIKIPSNDTDAIPYQRQSISYIDC
jgi:hypothetical protein